MTTMSDTTKQSNETKESNFSGLEAEASMLQKLAKALKEAAKSEAFGRPEFGKQIEEASRLAERINWPELKATIAKHSAAALERDEENLRGRREKLMQAATAAKWAVQQGGHFDRLDIFQLEYEGTTVVVKLGGVVLERVKEPDGEKLFAHLQQARTGLDKLPFDREDFFKRLKGAHTICRFATMGGDEFVAVRDLHREMVLERVRNSEKFRKSAELKNIDAYPMTQFIFDLARFLRGGIAVGNERLVTQTPSMRESKETIHIPNLDHPSSGETAAARLAIKPV
jgi:hypothetical protein